MEGGARKRRESVSGNRARWEGTLHETEGRRRWTAGHGDCVTDLLLSEWVMLESEKKFDFRLQLI